MSNKLTAAQAWQLQEDLRLCHVWLELNCLAEDEGWGRRLVDEVFELLREAFRFSYRSELRSEDSELNPSWQELEILAENEDWSSFELEAVSDLVQKAHQEGFFAAWEQIADDEIFRQDLRDSLHLADDWFKTEKNEASLGVIFAIFVLSAGVYISLFWGAWTIWHYLF